MKKNQILGIAVILLIAVVSVGAVLSQGGQTNYTAICQNNNNCFRNRASYGICDQSDCPEECGEQKQTQEAGIVRRCSM